MRKAILSGTIVLIVIAVGLFLGCEKAIDADSPTGANFPVSGGALERSSPSVATGAQTITVMTQNMYVGADVDAVLAALISSDPDDDFPALLSAIQTLEQTYLPARIEAMAKTIARTRPHAVGLQEVSVIDIDLTGFGFPITINMDFLSALEAALAGLGLNYTVAATVENVVANPVPGIGLVDYDALLVDADRVTVTSSGGQNFTVNLGFVAPDVELKRGWVWAEVMIGGAPYMIANTHLEGSAPPPIRDALLAAQATELAASLPTNIPVIVMGDLNNIPGSLMYQVMTGAGFTDAWAALRPGRRGYTCCQAPDLSNKISVLEERIDYVFARGVGHPKAGLKGQMDLIGDVPSDRVAGPFYPIWPSDHAGLILRILMPPAKGLQAAEAQTVQHLAH